jgi:hypothetical protein
MEKVFIREILLIREIRDTYKQALRGLFVTGTSESINIEPKEKVG